MNTTEMQKKLQSGDYDRKLTELYGESALEARRERFCDAIKEFAALYGEDREISLFSVPGRSEISGNHTDHNRGKVIAAAVDLDIIAVASPNTDDTVRIKSAGFPEDRVPARGNEVDESKFYTAEALIAGTCREFENRGYKVGGYDAYTTSSVLKGSGLSSSAAFEVMVGTIMSYFYNDGSIDNAELAQIAQYSENVFFGKPSGLMDQTACAVGGFTTIDFEDPAKAKITKLGFDMSAAGYSLCIVNTGGNHADLNDDYASVPREMKAVAAELGQDVLRGVTFEDIVNNASKLRESVGDRAILRAMHFVSENDRVTMQAKALEENDLDSFFKGVMASGHSSFMYLQNVYTTKNVSEQGLSLALAITERLLSGKHAAWRVHGGGFAGTIQAFVPNDLVSEYRAAVDKVFGDGACAVLKIRKDGAIKLA